MEDEKFVLRRIHDNEHFSVYEVCEKEGKYLDDDDVDIINIEAEYMEAKYRKIPGKTQRFEVIQISSFRKTVVYVFDKESPYYEMLIEMCKVCSEFCITLCKHEQEIQKLAENVYSNYGNSYEELSDIFGELGKQHPDDSCVFLEPLLNITHKKAGPFADLGKLKEALENDPGMLDEYFDNLDEIGETEYQN